MVSPTYISGLVIVIGALCQLFKINVATEEVTRIIEGLAIGICGIIVIVRRLTKGGVNIIGMVKK